MSAHDLGMLLHQAVVKSLQMPESPIIVLKVEWGGEPLSIVVAAGDYGSRALLHIIDEKCKPDPRSMRIVIDPLSGHDE